MSKLVKTSLAQFVGMFAEELLHVVIVEHSARLVLILNLVHDAFDSSLSFVDVGGMMPS